MQKRNVVICIVTIILCLGGIILAETVNINPHKIVLNAEGASDDVQANVNITLSGSRIVDFDVRLEFDGILVAEAESAFYCVLDDILIVGFDRITLQNNPDVQAMANKIVTATVGGSVTVINSVGDEIITSFSGSDTVEIVAPGKKER
ncbi:MAG: hypothetical protein RQ760_21960 [Sedimentisphaerales bacterium]|nr:hypothetical protein [Sedimentisphaerales bacterium]